PVERHADPVIEIDKPRALSRRGAYAALRNAAEEAVLGQLVDAFVEIGGTPEAALDDTCVVQNPRLLPELHEENIPGTDRHDGQDQTHAPDDEVAVLDERVEAVGMAFTAAHGRRRRFYGGRRCFSRSSRRRSGWRCRSRYSRL